jgi:hypothetical protein
MRDQRIEINPFLQCEDVYSMRGSKKLKPEFSRIRGGGSMSAMSICSMDFDKSSTENGMLQT